MLRILLCCTAIFALAASAALAQDRHPFMGNYHGEFSSPFQSYDIRAEVIAEGGPHYRAVFFVGSDSGWQSFEERVQIHGVADEEDLVLTFEGDLDFGSNLGGSYTLNATVQDEVFEGSFENADRSVDFSLTRVFLESPTLGMEPPKGAMLLFDGNHMDHWERWPNEKWCLTGDGAMEVCGSNLKTIEEFGDTEIHVEFRTPLMAHARGQARGNSGVYVHGRYEIQVLDSFGQLPRDNYCGGIYQISAPIVNATLPPTEWQTYDITYRAPRFDEDGEKVEHAVITVKHNGILIHDDLVMEHATPGGVSDVESAMGPLLLQDHGDRVAFRNIWIRPLED